MIDLSGYIGGYGTVSPWSALVEAPARAVIPARRAGEAAQVLPDLDAAVQAAQLRDGMCLSFHHHLRNGDGVLNAVMDAIARAGLGDMELAPSSVFPVHAPLADHMVRGVVAGLRSGYVAGPVAEALAKGALVRPAVLGTHGGRARDIETGRVAIDVAFIAAAMADRAGNLTGAEGAAAFGPIGYGRVDAARAGMVVAVTDCLVDSLPCAPDIPAEQVDFIVPVARIGDAGGIASGTTRIAGDPAGGRIADMAAGLIEASGALCQGMTFQTGAGGISLAVAERLGRRMAARGIVGRFASGGITAPLVSLHRAGLLRELRDVQAFDLEAVHSYRSHTAHVGMSASDYANPQRADAVVNQLDAVILGASEVDMEFNVNVTTGGDGAILGGSGGHADCAAGADLCVIVTRLSARGGRSRIVEQVRTRTTPGRDVDAVVTEAGIAINPRRDALRARAQAAGLPVVTLDEMRAQVPGAVDQGRDECAEGPVVAICEYRDGRVIDVIRGERRT